MIALLLPLGGCCSDDGERPPWERADGAATAARDAGTPDGAADGGADAFSAVSGRVDLAGSRASVEVGGLRVTPGGLIRGWLEADLDADQDLDAALLQERPPEDELVLKRMKKRKLKLKDMIAQLESRLIPDMDA